MIWKLGLGCKVAIDSGSINNSIFEELVEKYKVGNSHPKPYRMLLGYKKNKGQKWLGKQQR